MPWLIKTNAATTGKPHLGNGTPSRLLHFRALNTLLRERSHVGLQIVAHEVEFVGIVLRRMKCRFCRRQGEDQPAVTRIHRFELENVAEKGAIRFSVLAVDHYGSAGNHLPSPELDSNRRSRSKCPYLQYFSGSFVYTSSLMSD